MNRVWFLGVAALLENRSATFGARTGVGAYVGDRKRAVGRFPTDASKMHARALGRCREMDPRICGGFLYNRPRATRGRDSPTAEHQGIGCGVVGDQRDLAAAEIDGGVEG